MAITGSPLGMASKTCTCVIMTIDPDCKEATTLNKVPAIECSTNRLPIDIIMCSATCSGAVHGLDSEKACKAPSKVVIEYLRATYELTLEAPPMVPGVSMPDYESCSHACESCDCSCIADESNCITD